MCVSVHVAYYGSYELLLVAAQCSLWLLKAAWLQYYTIVMCCVITYYYLLPFPQLLKRLDTLSQKFLW
jgi:hypothetical protein